MVSFVRVSWVLLVFIQGYYYFLFYQGLFISGISCFFFMIFDSILFLVEFELISVRRRFSVERWVQSYFWIIFLYWVFFFELGLFVSVYLFRSFEKWGFYRDRVCRGCLAEEGQSLGGSFRFGFLLVFAKIFFVCCFVRFFGFIYYKDDFGFFQFFCGREKGSRIQLLV